MDAASANPTPSIISASASASSAPPSASPSLRTAIQLKAAIDSAPAILPSIGTCVTAEVLFKQKMGQEEEEDDQDDDDSEDAAESRRWKKAKIEEEVDSFEKLVEAYDATEIVETVDEKQLKAMKLTITKTGCEYSDSLHRLSKSNDHLVRWFQAGDPSPYGDVRTQTTVIDKDVRDAVEFNTADFTVSPELLAYVQQMWAEHFFPTKVRVEPYKINVYGPGGHFKPHQDTPAKDLVGTVLLGLGDTSDSYLVMENEQCTAQVGRVAAFFPSVVHSVEKITRGHRATLALKVYRQNVEETCDEATVAAVTAVLSKWPLPFGLLLNHEYSVGTSDMSGLDAVLVQAVKALPHSEVHTFPVVTTIKTTRDVTDDGDKQPATVTSRVFPLTDFHIDRLLGRRSAEAEPGWVAMLAKLSSGDGVPFFTFSHLSTCGLRWRHHFDAGAEHTGNSSRPEEQDSVYLHYAVVVLPKV